MKVACNNKYKYWCPHGTKNCNCNVYNDRNYEYGEDVNFTCTNILKDSKNCKLVFLPENNNELHVKKFIDMLACGMSIKEAVSNMEYENITMEQFLDILSKMNSMV